MFGTNFYSFGPFLDFDLNFDSIKISKFILKVHLLKSKLESKTEKCNFSLFLGHGLFYFQHDHFLILTRIKDKRNVTPGYF